MNRRTQSQETQTMRTILRAAISNPWGKLPACPPISVKGSPYKLKDKRAACRKIAAILKPLFITLVAIATPAFAGDPSPTAEPATWEVRVFKLDNNKWANQDDHCLKTTDLKRAVD